MNSPHNESIKTINEFLMWTKELGGLRFLYRGLSNSNWKLEASGYRRLKRKGEEEFQKSIVTLLDRASRLRLRNRHGERYSDLELLAELQHYGAATCLIDFTTDPLIALWFSCYTEPDKNGRVCAMSTEHGNIFVEINEASNYEELRQQSIEYFFEKREWWKWNPEHQNDRILAQKSAFIFGKAEMDEEFYKTIEVDKNSKQEIMEELKNKHGITEKYLFNDFAAFVLSNAHDKPLDDYSAGDHLYLGLMLLENENYDDAKRHFSNAIESHTDNDKENEKNRNLFYAYIGRGDVEYVLGNMQSAITDYDKAVEIIPKFTIKSDPNFAWVYISRGNAKYKLDDNQGSIADYDKAIGINPNYDAAYNNRGNVRYQLEDHQGAIKDYDKAIEINPNFSEAFDNRGNVKYELKYYKGAIKDYDKAIEINQNFTESYNNRGIAKAKLKDYQSALSDFEKAIELDPNCADAYNNRGSVKYEQKDYKGAIKDYEKAIEINPNFTEAYKNRGRTKKKLDDNHGAEEDLNKAQKLEQQPTD